MGEINLLDEFGSSIVAIVKKYKINKVLEIGSWDGTGSTTCLIEALKTVPDSSLSCLEVREERYKQLVECTKNYDFVKCYNESSISQKSLVHKDFNKIWTSKYNKIRESCRNKVESWYNIEMGYLSKVNAGFLEKNNEYYDGVLIDGGEFFGYSEYTLLKDRCKAFFLDDCVYGFKNRQVGEELNASKEWKLVAGSKETRNGFAIFVKQELETR